MSGSFPPASQRPFCNPPPPLNISGAESTAPDQLCEPRKPLSLSGPQFTLLKNGDNNDHCHEGVLWGPPEEMGPGTWQNTGTWLTINTR